MATMNEVVAYIDQVKPNIYTDAVKFQWMNTLEGLIAREVMDEEAPALNLPDDADTPLLVESPFDDIYGMYVSAMIDFHNREYDHYNNSVLLFKERLEQFKTWYIRTHINCKPRNFRNVMG